MARLFGRLKDEIDTAVEAPAIGQVLGSTEQHGHVTIVTAGVHLAGVGRPIIEAVLFGNCQGIHICAQPDTGRTIPSLEHPDDTGPTDFSLHLQPKALQQPGDRGCGAHLFATQLRVCMEVVPPLPHQVAKVFGDEIGLFHGLLS